MCVYKQNLALHNLQGVMWYKIQPANFFIINGKKYFLFVAYYIYISPPLGLITPVGNCQLPHTRKCKVPLIN